MITLLHGDARVLFPLEAILGLFDHLISDPPYSSHTHVNAVSCAANSKCATGARAREFGFEHLGINLRRYLAGVAARVRGWSLLYSDCEMAHALTRACVASDAEYVRQLLYIPEIESVEDAGQLPWRRWSMPQLSADRPPQGWEPIVILRHRSRSEWYGPGWLTHLDHHCLRQWKGKAAKLGKKHPTEKPLDQSLDLVHWFTRPGQVVFDPTAGRAGIGLACRVLGRQYVGCELEAEHAEIGQQRLVEPVGWYPNDAERLERWLKSLNPRIAQCEAIIAKDPVHSVQARRCLEAMRRDLVLAA